MAQKLANFFHLTLGLGNYFQRRIRVKLTGLNALQQTALKRPATFRTFVVNPAKRAIETGARLRESLLVAFFSQRQPKFSQPLGVVALAQFHIGKQNAIAAKPAVGTELVNAVYAMNGSSGRASAPGHVFKIRRVAQASGLLFRASRSKPLWDVNWL
jgi:hypothetical protein